MRRGTNVLLAVVCPLLLAGALRAQPAASPEERIEGLLIGSLVGDAAGAPTEFAPPDRSAWTATDTVLDATGRAELGARFRLAASRRPAEAYGPWTADGPPGTLTDDSRFKILFLRSLEAAGHPDRDAFARAILAWHADSTGPYGPLPAAWLDEFAFAARWVLGERDPAVARPPERAWGGMATMAGQMPFLPIAALAPGRPEAAYRAVWDVDFLDTGTGLDLNAALVAGLAEALAPDASWESVEHAMRTTDPFGFAEVPWVPRAVDRWLDEARAIADDADGRAARLFDGLDRRLGAVTWWEAHVPMTVVFACARFTGFDPLATMQLILEFGHDTDSYLQVAGALFGALHGPDVFPEPMRRAVRERLRAEYGVAFDTWPRILGAATLRP